MTKRITFEERAKQEVINRCVEMFERLCRSEAGRLPDELRITMRAMWASAIAETEERVVIPKPILYATSGKLSGEVQGHNISVSHDGEGHFRGVLNGEPYDSLSSRFVEEELKIQVQRKMSGSQAGYPSEPVPRAVWRYFVELYNKCDPTVHYERTTE